MIEAGAELVEADGAVAGAVPGVHDQWMPQLVHLAQHQRGLLRDHQHVEAAEELEVVAVDQQLGRPA